jgi:RNA polymerase sigma-70 factor (ECF subfamily)
MFHESRDGRQTRVDDAESVSARTPNPGKAAPSITFRRRRSSGAAADSLLAEIASRGDGPACLELIRRYRSRIYLIAYGYVRDREEALDITQETLLQMLEGLPRFRAQASFFTWLHRIAVNRCIDHSRHRSRRPPPLSLEEMREQTGVEPADERAVVSPLEAVMASELRRQIWDAIAAVPDPFRDVVMLSDVEGIPIAEIARILRCPVNTVKSRLHRGRCHVRRRLSPYLEGEW